MTDLERAARQALDALERASRTMDLDTWLRMSDAVIALRKALR